VIGMRSRPSRLCHAAHISAEPALQLPAARRPSPLGHPKLTIIGCIADGTVGATGHLQQLMPTCRNILESCVLRCPGLTAAGHSFAERKGTAASGRDQPDSVLDYFHPFAGVMPLLACLATLTISGVRRIGS